MSDNAFQVPEQSMVDAGPLNSQIIIKPGRKNAEILITVIGELEGQVGDLSINYHMWNKIGREMARQASEDF